jgi:hypothetical protein
MRRNRDTGIERLLLTFMPTAQNTRRIAEMIIAPSRAPE